MLIQSDPVNTDIEGSVESVRINEVTVLSGLNLEKMKRFFSPGTKQSVRKRGSTVVNIMIYNVRMRAQVRSWGSLLDLSSILLIEIYQFVNETTSLQTTFSYMFSLSTLIVGQDV